MAMDIFIKRVKNMQMFLLIVYFHIPQTNCEKHPILEGTYGLIDYDSPWHVAIYNRNETLVCGGTIIHPKMVLSAAHCFYDEDKNRRHNIADYQIIVSKFTRNYTTRDNEKQNTYWLEEIRFSQKGYTGLRSYFSADIAILILDRQIAFNPSVSQAHVDWESLLLGEYPIEGTPGKVSGWGLNEHGNYNEKLMTFRLPFISRARCLITVPVDFQSFITFDKFCAGSDQEGSPSVLEGDSGGGLFFEKEGKFHLRGIVSVKQRSSTSIAAFTDLSDHARWILSVMNELDNQGSIKKKIGLCSIERNPTTL